MTEHKWKPVPHDRDCEVMVLGCLLPCDCNGTRWSGYRERVGDCAAVWALCEWFGKMGRYLPPIERDESMDRTYIPLPGGWEIQTKGKGSTFRVWDGKTGQRWPIQDCEWGFGHADWERMARDIHAASRREGGGE